MNKSVYRKTDFIMLCIVIILLIAIAWKVNVYQTIVETPFVPIVVAVVSNSWFCGVSCSIIAVLLIYKWQVWYSKKKLKLDFRCNEIIEDVYIDIEEYQKFVDKIPSIPSCL